MRHLPLTSLLALLVGCAGVKLDPKSPYAVRAAPTEIQLGENLSTLAEITYPDKGDGPHPTVVLVPSAGPMDMDHTMSGPEGATLLFSDLADDLSSRGFAVVRYNKRHVRGFKDFDLRRFVADDDQRTQVEDLEHILKAVRSHPRIDADHLFLYGFGEGGQVAAEVARTQPVTGVVLHAAPGIPYPERMQEWFESLVIPHLEGFAFEGMLNGLMLAQSINEPVAPPVRDSIEMLAVSYTRGAQMLKLSPLVDLDKNGLLELEIELEPRIPDLVDLAFGPIGNLRQYAGDRALPTLDELGPQVNAPLLVLQGENDATTSPANADRIEAALTKAGHPSFVVQRFPGVGHTLGVAPSRIRDLPRPMAIGPRDAVIQWLVARASDSSDTTGR